MGWKKISFEEITMEEGQRSEIFQYDISRNTASRIGNSLSQKGGCRTRSRSQMREKGDGTELGLTASGQKTLLWGGGAFLPV